MAEEINEHTADKKIKLIIFDLDYTLYNPEAKVIYDGVHDILKFCKEKDIAMAIASCNGYAKEIIKDLNLHHYFFAIETHTKYPWCKNQMLLDIMQDYKNKFGDLSFRNVLFYDDLMEHTIKASALSINTHRVDCRTGIQASEVHKYICE
uniref:FCP1 homology domain-containing protein n=1 Tax=viral metagenome TaxID=1070528 RepID=A0A6C0EC77_9ZZZZ